MRPRNCSKEGPPSSGGVQGAPGIQGGLNFPLAPAQEAAAPRAGAPSFRSATSVDGFVLLRWVGLWLRRRRGRPPCVLPLRRERGRASTAAALGRWRRRTDAAELLGAQAGNGAAAAASCEAQLAAGWELARLAAARRRRKAARAVEFCIWCRERRVWTEPSSPAAWRTEGHNSNSAMCVPCCAQQAAALPSGLAGLISDRAHASPGRAAWRRSGTACRPAGLAARSSASAHRGCRAVQWRCRLKRP